MNDPLLCLVILRPVEITLVECMSIVDTATGAVDFDDDVAHGVAGVCCVRSYEETRRGRRR